MSKTNFIYNDSLYNFTQYENLILIDKQVLNYEIFHDNVNSQTLPIVINYTKSSNNESNNQSNINIKSELNLSRENLKKNNVISLNKLNFNSKSQSSTIT